MNKPAEPVFATRQTVTLELPLTKNTRVMHPEQVILKVGEKYYDLGAYCYALRSDKQRKQSQPRGVALDTFLKKRRGQVMHLIKVLSRLFTDSGRRISTIQSYAGYLKLFLDWADANGHHNCLSGGDTTRYAYLAWAEATRERYRRQEFGAQTHNNRLRYLRELLEATTGLDDLYRGTRSIKETRNHNGGTDPLALHDLTHSVALNQALFDGLCDLVLEQQPFPYKLLLPASLGWADNHLWLFPTHQWRLPPHQWGAEREKLKYPGWAYDYSAGRLATPDEILHRYAMWRFPSTRRKVAKRMIAKAQARIGAANANVRDRVRIMLGMIAHNAFLLLFFCNTGANESVVREIETDGEIDVATSNQQYRSIKYRASGKLVTLTVPAAFMPSLRRFMELRRYLLATRVFPYLFFTYGVGNAKPPRQIGFASLESQNNLLRAIDPQLPWVGSRKLRATVSDWYQRNHDASVTARVLQNSEQTTQAHYDAGSTTDHREELSLFFTSVAESAKRQRVIQASAVIDGPPLEEGGHCENFRHPQALADHVPVKPTCQDGQGCLFCTRRILIACEEDARKVASAAFVMEQVILGPKHEEALRPLITKCDEDLKKIAAFGNSHVMVQRVCQDVFENGNLSPFFADKYQLFLDLGVVV